MHSELCAVEALWTKAVWLETYGQFKIDAALFFIAYIIAASGAA